MLGAYRRACLDSTRRRESEVVVECPDVDFSRSDTRRCEREYILSSKQSLKLYNQAPEGTIGDLTEPHTLKKYE
ncbi:hypothetical protein BDV06DRAFT_190499 [Aspergillus oleicola]